MSKGKRSVISLVNNPDLKLVKLLTDLLSFNVLDDEAIQVGLVVVVV